MNQGKPTIRRYSQKAVNIFVGVVAGVSGIAIALVNLAFPEHPEFLTLIPGIVSLLMLDFLGKLDGPGTPTTKRYSERTMSIFVAVVAAVAGVGIAVVNVFIPDHSGFLAVIPAIVLLVTFGFLGKLEARNTPEKSDDSPAP